MQSLGCIVGWQEVMKWRPSELSKIQLPGHESKNTQTIGKESSKTTWRSTYGLADTNYANS